MAAGLEYQVVSKVIELSDIHSVIKLKIDESFFFVSECRAVFKYLWDHYHARETFGQVPSFHIVQSIYGRFPYTPTADPLETLCNQLRLHKMRMDLLDAASHITDTANTDPKAALQYVRELSAKMSTRHEVNDDMLLSDAYDVLLRNYQTVAEGKGLTGLPWPWEILNAETQGIHPGEFIVLYGRPKNMKTWISLFLVTYINYYANARILVLSLEMPTVQLIRRVAAIRCGVNYKLFKAGKLQPLEYYRVFNELNSLKTEAATPSVDGVRRAGFMVAGQGEGGISHLHAKIREFKPDLVLVDGMYLMRDDRQKVRTIDWKAIAHISQDLKRTAQEFDIPIIGVNQANRKADKDPKKADLSEVAYTDALSQDCDMAIRVTKRIDKKTLTTETDSEGNEVKKGVPEVVLSLPGMREGDLDHFLINAIPATDFSFKSSIVMSEEDEQEEKTSKKSGGKKQAQPKPFPHIKPTRLRKT